MGLDDAVEYIVDYTSVDVPAVRADEFDPGIMRPLSREERNRRQTAQRNGDEATLGEFRSQRQQRQRADRRQMATFQEWWLKRLIESPRPLEEKMTLFWHGHFATELPRDRRQLPHVPAEPAVPRAGGRELPAR